jgi:hypothetical protein
MTPRVAGEVCQPVCCVLASGEVDVCRVGEGDDTEKVCVASQPDQPTSTVNQKEGEIRSRPPPGRFLGRLCTLKIPCLNIRMQIGGGQLDRFYIMSYKHGSKP